MAFGLDYGVVSVFLLVHLELHSSSSWLGLVSFFYFFWWLVASGLDCGVASNFLLIHLELHSSSSMSG